MDSNIAGLASSHVSKESMQGNRRPSRCRYSKESFIEAARRVHGDKYDYSDLDYVTLSGSISINCKLHGRFEQKGQHHLTGAGCRTCCKANIGLSGKQRALANFFAPNWAKDAVYHPSQKNINRAFVGFTCNLHGPMKVDPQQFKKINQCPLCKKENNRSTSAQTLPLFLQYKRSVWSFTKKSWKHRQGFINHDNKVRGRDTFHLDHEVSIADGFRNNIPPFIIGHWTNLHVKPAKENMQKGDISDKDIELLIATFDWSLKYHGGMYEYARN